MPKKTTTGLVVTGMCLLAATLSAATIPFKTPVSTTHSGNKPNNPFLAGNVTFSNHVNGLTEGSSIRNVFFKFGTPNGSDVIRIPPLPNVPETGASIALLGTVLSGFVLLRRKLN